MGRKIGDTVLIGYVGDEFQMDGKTIQSKKTGGFCLFLPVDERMPLGVLTYLSQSLDTRQLRAYPFNQKLTSFLLHITGCLVTQLSPGNFDSQPRMNYRTSIALS